MSWVGVAILSAAIFSAVSIFDSHLVSKRMPSLRAFLLLVGIIYLAYSLVLFILFPLPEGLSVWPILVAIVSGIFRTGALTIMLYSLKKEEVSRVVPVVYTYPVFVAIMAASLLGETLYYLEWLAIVIVVTGAVMVSIRQGPTGSAIRLSKSLFLLFGSSLLFAMTDITSKYALAYISFWNMFWLSTFCMSGIFIIASLRPHVLRQLRDMKQRNSAMALVIFNDMVLSPIAIILQFWAIEKGQVSLVSTIIGSRPVFVLIYALILSRISPMLLDWHPGKGMLALRLIAIAMIVGGIAIIHLT